MNSLVAKEVITTFFHPVWDETNLTLLLDFLLMFNSSIPNGMDACGGQSFATKRFMPKGMNSCGEQGILCLLIIILFADPIFATLSLREQIGSSIAQKGGIFPNACARSE